MKGGLAVIVGAAFLLAIPLPSAGQTVPGRLDLQGFIRTSGGQPLTGTVSIEVRLYDSEAAVVPFFTTEVAQVAVAGGRFSIHIDGVDEDLFADHPSAFVEFVVDGGAPFPREPVSSVPYAFQAARAGTCARVESASGIPEPDAVARWDVDGKLAPAPMYVSGSRVGVGTKTPAATFHVAGHDAIVVPSGSDAQRPAAPVEGAMRLNPERGVMEVYVGGARDCWMSVNTPPIGSSYIQWAGVADPATIYPCTTWVSDLQGGEFIRAVGGRSNVAADGSLSGLAQGFATQAFVATLTGGVKEATATTDSALGGHDHGGVANTSTSGASHTHSGATDAGGATHSHAFSVNTSSVADHLHAVSLSNTHNHAFSYRSNEGAEDHDGDNSTEVADNSYHTVNSVTANTTITLSGNTAGAGGHAHTVAGNTNDSASQHSHSFTTAAADTGHAHQVTIPGADLAHQHQVTHGHLHDLAVSIAGLVTAEETRPVNVAVRFWRRTW